MHVRRQPFETVHNLVYDLLRRPMSLDELVEELGSGAPSDDPYGLLDWLLTDDRRVIWMSKDLFCRVDSIYEGITFAHRLTASEVDRGVIGDRGDWHLLIDHFGTVRLGSEDVCVSTKYSKIDENTLILGLDSVLNTCSPGTLCGLAVTELGLEFIPFIDEAEPPDDLVAAFTEALHAVADGRLGPTDLVDIVRSGLVGDRPRWLGTVPPLHELAVAAGRQVRRSQVASLSFDWDHWLATAPTRAASVRFHLNAAERRDLAAAVDEYRKWRDKDCTLAVTVGAKPAAATLSEPAVAEAFVATLVEYGDEAIADVALFAERVADLVDLEYRAGCRWIQSIAAEAADDFIAQERLLRETLSIHPDNDAATTELGWLLFDQSNFVEAYSRLSEADSDGELLDLIAEVTAPARSAGGRNDPCGCGSGQKYKRCHGGSIQPFSDRLALLYHKAARHIVDDGGNPTWWQWPRDWPGNASDWHRGLDGLDDLGVLTDILLTEGGGMTDLIDRRGASVLPLDEIEVLRQWARIPRRVWRVVKIDSDADRTTLEALDELAGSLVELEVHDPGGALDEGEMMIARLLPVEDGRHRLIGGMIPVTEANLTEALAMMAEPDLSPSETARRYIEFAELREDPAESWVMYVAMFETVRDDVDRWITDHASTTPVSLDPERDEHVAEGTGVDPSGVDVFIAYDNRVGLRCGGRLVIVSIDEEAHRSICAQVKADLPTAALIVERGVTMAVLRDEIEATHNRPPIEDPFAERTDYDTELPPIERALTTALVNEALDVLTSAVSTEATEG